MGILNKIRTWIDGEEAEHVLEDAAKNAKAGGRNHSEEFIIKLARAVEEVMQSEMVSLPQGTTLIPPEYIVFISEEDDRDWQGVKRKGLEQSLYHVLGERAREISKKTKLSTQSFSVEIRVDGTLEKDEVRVQHSWDEAESGKTGVIARAKKPSSPIAPKPAPIAAPVVPTPNNQPQYSPQQIAPTIAQIPYSQPIEQDDGEEKTVFQKRAPVQQVPPAPLFRLEIWQGNVRQNVIPIFQHEISIGRGSASKPVDIPLKNDAEISRRHCTLSIDQNGQLGLVSEGRNPTMLGNLEIPAGQKVPIKLGDMIGICSYVLIVK